MGTLTMELGGKVSIECGKTGYSTELEFKLRVSLESNMMFTEILKLQSFILAILGWWRIH